MTRLRTDELQESSFSALKIYQVKAPTIVRVKNAADKILKIGTTWEIIAMGTAMEVVNIKSM
mgnify:CR=1 FL=1